MEWISVKDRLPEINKEVILYYGTDIIQGFLSAKKDWYGSRIVRESMNDGYVSDPRICTMGGNFDFVTHWMPLPEPPKPQQP